VIGRGVISDLYQGEPILENRLAAPAPAEVWRPPFPWHESLRRQGG